MKNLKYLLVAFALLLSANAYADTYFAVSNCSLTVTSEDSLFESMEVEFLSSDIFSPYAAPKAMIRYTFDDSGIYLASELAYDGTNFVGEISNIDYLVNATLSINSKKATLQFTDSDSHNVFQGSCQF